MIETNRRTFLAGIGALIVAMHAPNVPGPLLGDRTFPPFSIDGYYWPSLMDLGFFITDVGRQVKSFGPLSLAERVTVAQLIDDAMDRIRPVGIRVNVLAPLEAIADGRFEVRESYFGAVTIREVVR